MVHRCWSITWLDFLTTPPGWQNSLSPVSPPPHPASRSTSIAQTQTPQIQIIMHLSCLPSLEDWPRLKTSLWVHSCWFLFTLQSDHQPLYNRARSYSADLFNPSEATAKLKRSFSARSLDLLSIDDDLDLCGQEETGTNGSETCCCYPVSLDTCYDILSDTDAFQVSRFFSKYINNVLPYTCSNKAVTLLLSPLLTGKPRSLMAPAVNQPTPTTFQNDQFKRKGLFLCFVKVSPEWF